MDRERASFERAMESLQKKFGRGVVSLQIPFGEEKAFRGTIDLVRMEAHMHQDGKRVDGPIPADARGRGPRKSTSGWSRWSPRAKTR